MFQGNGSDPDMSPALMPREIRKEMKASRAPYRRIKPARVTISLANGQVIDGIVNVGFEERVSDFLSAEDRPFISVFDFEKDRAVMILNKAHIVSVQPKEESSEFVERKANPFELKAT